MKCHSNDITSMFCLKDKSVLVTTSKDKSMRFWLVPASWERKNTTTKSQSGKNGGSGLKKNRFKFQDRIKKASERNASEAGKQRNAGR